MKELELDKRMTAKSWARIEALFDAAMAQPPARRADWLIERTGTDDWLRSHVSRLIEQVVAAGDEQKAPTTDAARAQASKAGLPPGTQIGNWRFDAALSDAGATSEIHCVERIDGRPPQRAALRLIPHKAAIEIERFHDERQVLARIDHPGIARLLDAGIAPDGRPFLVWEWVDGVALTQWCRERSVPLSQRLELFLQVCEAVAYAHRNLLVHGDLKPDSILVGAEARCRLTGFGRAGLVRSSDIDDERSRRMPAAYAYASPERLAQQRMTPASDVYSLGQLLFELLTGEKPCHRSHVSLSLMIERQLRAAPPSPSSMAAARIDAPIDARRLQGDLDAITALALQREPEHRYRSAAEFADDIRCHLEGRPVQARQASLAYAVRHHRVAATFAAIAIAGLLAGAVLVLWQAQEARFVSEAAQREAARAAATTAFLVDALRAGTSRSAPGGSQGSLTVRELLDLSTPRIAERFRDDPATQIELLGINASIYRQLGDEARAHALDVERLTQMRRLYGDAHPAVILGLLDDARRASERHDHARAQRRLGEVDPLIRKAGLDKTTTRAHWWLLRSRVLDERGDVRDPAALGKALELYERLAPDDPGLVEALTSLGWREVRGNPATAEQHFLRAITLAQKTLNDGEEVQQRAWPGLARAREEQGKYDDALEAHDRSGALIDQTYGVDHASAWIPTARYASALHRAGQRERALAQFDKLMARIPADSSGRSLDERARALYAERLVAEGRPLEAIPSLEAALEADRKKNVLDAENLPHDLLILGDAYDRAGMSSKARGVLKASLDEQLQADAQESENVGIARERWGRFLLEQGDPKAAQAQFETVLTQTADRSSELAALAHGGLARLAQQQRDWDSALASSTHAVVGFENVTGPRDVRTGPYLWLIHAESLRRVEDEPSARIWAQRALEASRRYDAPDAASIREAERMLTRIGR